MTDKHRAADAAIFVHPSGKVLRLDPERVDEKAEKIASKQGFERYDPPKDGFRPRRKRDRKHMQKLIADGVVAADESDRQPHQTYGPETFVVDVPLGRLGAAGSDTGV